MKHYKIIMAGFIALSAIFSACQKDFLERYPLDEVSSADFFKQPNDMMVYLNQFYNGGLLPCEYEQLLGGAYRGGGDDMNSDNEFDIIHPDERLKGTRTVGYTDRHYWEFEEVRSINYFFDNYKKCTAPFKDYKQYVGEAYFFRAVIYFQLLQTFGDVPWLSTVPGTNSPELFAPRTPRNIVADHIIADLDSASLHLSEDKTNGCSRINKWMALLFQSRVALYEGTWEKYHSGDPFGVSGAQPDIFLNKAVESSSAVMNSGLFDIYATGKPTSDYGDLFIQRDYSSNAEVLFWKKFSIVLNIVNNKNYQQEYPGGKTCTKGLADSYLCTDGKPITGNLLFGGYDSLTNEMQNRDPRFYQTIFTPDAPWKIDATGTTTWRFVYKKLSSASQYNAPCGYTQRKAYDPIWANHDVGFEETPSIYFRYAEVLLNFAEAKAELGTISQADIDISIKKLRDRVGMPNIDLANIATDPMWDFPALSPLINEIRRERRVELALEGFRWPDIARWAAADELILGKRPIGFKKSQTTSSTFPVDANGFLDPLQAGLPTGYGFVLNRDYLNPLPEDQIVLNSNLVQNPNW